MVNISRKNVGYGLTNPLQDLAPLSIEAKRAPLAHDIAEISTVWIDTVANLAYILVDVTAGVATWTAVGGGGGTEFTRINLPNTDLAGDGVIYFNNIRYFHNYTNGGSNNIYLGANAGFLDATNFASANVVIGANSASQLVNSSNTILGSGTGQFLGNASSNVVIGQGALGGASDPDGSVIIGQGAAGSMLGGTGNIIIGQFAGSSLIANETLNILIGSSGASGESQTIRIGSGGSQHSCFIQGINGIPTGVNDAIPVLVDSNGQLGTVSSSMRVKENIYSMGDYSSKIHSLRPVVFNYKGRKPSEKTVGLIAEEVKKVMPSLHIADKEGNSMTVRYLDLIPMLLNEVQKLRKELDQLKKINNDQKGIL